MALSWTTREEEALAAAMDTFPVSSGKCAALARRVLPIAREQDPHARGLTVRPRGAARFLAAKHPHARMWAFHTLVGTRKHHVDALTKADGCEETLYLKQYFDHPEALTVSVVNVDTVDPGIEDVDA